MVVVVVVVVIVVVVVKHVRSEGPVGQGAGDAMSTSPLSLPQNSAISAKSY